MTLWPEFTAMGVTVYAGEPALEFELSAPWKRADFEKWLALPVTEPKEGNSYPCAMTLDLPEGHRPVWEAETIFRRIAEVCAGKADRLEIRCAPYASLTVRGSDGLGNARRLSEVQMFPLCNREREHRSDSWLAAATRQDHRYSYYVLDTAKAYAETRRLSRVTLQSANSEECSIAAGPTDFDDLHGRAEEQFHCSANAAGECKFESVPPGDYAVCAFDGETGICTEVVHVFGAADENLRLNSTQDSTLALRVTWPEPDDALARYKFIIAPGVPGYNKPHDGELVIGIEYPKTKESVLSLGRLPAGVWRVCEDSTSVTDNPTIRSIAGQTVSLAVDLRENQFATWRVREFLGDEELRRFRLHYVRATGGNMEWGRDVDLDDNEKSEIKLPPGSYVALLGGKSWEFTVKAGETREDVVRVPMRRVSFQLDEETASYFDAAKDPIALWADVVNPYNCMRDAIEERVDALQKKPQGGYLPLAQLLERKAVVTLPALVYRFRFAGSVPQNEQVRAEDWRSFTISVDLRGEGDTTIAVNKESFPELAPFELELRGGKPGSKWYVNDRDLHSTLLDPFDIEDDGRTDEADYSYKLDLWWTCGSTLNRRFLGQPKDFALYLYLHDAKTDFRLRIPVKSPGRTVVDFDKLESWPRLSFVGRGKSDWNYHGEAYFECENGTTGWCSTYQYESPHCSPFVMVPPGAVKIWIYRERPFWGGKDIAKLALIIKTGNAEIDLDSISFSNDQRGKLKISLEGLPKDPALRQRMWLKGRDTEWATRAGYVFIGHCVEIRRLEEGVEESRCAQFSLGYCESIFQPDLAKLYATSLPPGRYKVIPWQGASEADCRVVELKAGETTSVRIRMD